MATEQGSVLTFKYRLYPTCRQVEALELQLRECARLYNAALQERRDAWKMHRKRISFYSQDLQLKEIRAAGDTGIVGFDVARGVLRRVDRAFSAFYRRCRAGDTPGHPRFKSSARFDSFSIDDYGNSVSIGADGRLKCPGVGRIKVNMHRPMSGTPKSVTVRRSGGRWFVAVACADVPSALLPDQGDSVGIDVGLTAFATCSDGAVIEAPRYFRKAARNLRRLQRSVSRRTRGSRRRRKAITAVARANDRVKNLRTNFHHKVSRDLVNRFGLIAVEDLNVKGLARMRLSKSVHDAGWSSFTEKLAYKAARAGREFVMVDPRGTSQACLCGASAPKTLADRWHLCLECGLSAPRDLVSAQLIHRLGLSRQAPTVPIGAVACEAKRSRTTAAGRPLDTIQS